MIAAASAWRTASLVAQAPPATHPTTGKGENIVLQNAMRQIEVIKDRLQHAPKDFGGHKEAAIDALNHALNELEQAVQYGKK